MRNLPPAVRQKIAVALKEKMKQGGLPGQIGGSNPIPQGVANPSPMPQSPPQMSALKLPQNPMTAPPIMQEGQRLLTPRFMRLKGKLTGMR